MVQIRLMTGADLPLGMRLKAANSWNQTEADWRRYLDLQPDGCFVAAVDANPVGTLAPADVQAALAIDREVTQTDRGKLLLRLAGEFPETMRVERGASGIEGFRAARPGARAIQIGPCVARGTAGAQLLEGARRQ